MGTTRLPIRRPARADGLPIPVDVPPDQVVVISGHREGLEVFRSPKVGKALGGAESAVVGGNINVLDGQRHTTRRRAFNRAFRREGLAWIKENITLPAITHQLERVSAKRDADGVARIDLAGLMHRAFMEFSANLIGLHGTKQMLLDEEIDDLLSLYPSLEAAREVRFSLSSPEEKAAIIKRGVTAKEEYAKRHYEPALEATEGLLAVDAPEGAQDRYEILSIIARKVDPSHEEHDLGVRDTIYLLGAAIDTSTQVTVTVVAELEEWFKLHPEDYSLRTDIAFLAGAVAETIRFRGSEPPPSVHHDPTMTLIRIALEDFTLSTGRFIKAGQWIALKMRDLDGDESVYGRDAREFNPRREVPVGVPRYGLGFGAGAHQCIGLPVVMGTEGTDGTIPQILQALYLAGLQPDPDRPPRWSEDMLMLKWESFPVTFSSANMPEPQTLASDA